MLLYHQVVGIDIGVSSARAVLAARRTGIPVVIDSAEIPLPSDLDAIPRVVRNLLEDHGWARKPCVLGLSSERLVLRSFPLDPKDPRPEEQIIHLETEPYLEMDSNGTIVEHVRMGEATSSHILFAATRTTTISHVLERMVLQGITVVDVVPNAVALYNAMIHHRDTGNQTFASVELGQRGCELIVGTRKALLFARRFSSTNPFPPTGEDHHESLTGEQKQQIKVCADHWALHIRECLSLFSSQETGQGKEPTHLVLCGPGSRLPEIPGLLASKSGIPTSRWEHGLKSSQKNLGGKEVATGLAFSRVDSRGLELSMLPPKQKETMTLRWQKRYWIAASGFAMIAMALLVLSSHLRAGQLRANINALSTRLQKLENRGGELKTLDMENEFLESQIWPLRVASHNGPALTTVLTAVAKAKHPDDWIILIADSNTYFAGDKDEDKKESVPAESLPAPWALKEIIVEGYTPIKDLTILESMIEKIRNHPGIHKADLLADDKIQANPQREAVWGELEMTLFVIQISPAHPSHGAQNFKATPSPNQLSGKTEKLTRN